jgi:hypothetical protein
MEGSDLKNKLETVFGEYTVIHMMTGKAVQKALRRHLLVDKCLHNQLVKETTKDYPEMQILLDQAGELYNSLLNGEIILTDGTCSAELIQYLKIRSVNYLRSQRPASCG